MAEIRVTIFVAIMCVHSFRDIASGRPDPYANTATPKALTLKALTASFRSLLAAAAV